jgi:hypothetical protein
MPSVVKSGISVVVVAGWDSSVGYGPVLESRLGKDFPKSTGANPVQFSGNLFAFPKVKQPEHDVDYLEWSYTGVCHHGLGRKLHLDYL